MSNVINVTEEGEVTLVVEPAPVLQLVIEQAPEVALSVPPPDTTPVILIFETGPAGGAGPRGEDGLPGETGPRIYPYRQPDEPLEAEVGDIWLDTDEDLSLPTGARGARGAGGSTFTYTGPLSTYSGPAWYNDSGSTLTIRSVRTTLLTPGTTATVIDVMKNGTSIWTSSGSRPSLGSGVSTLKATNMDVTSMADGDSLSISIVTAGTGAETLVVQVEVD